MLGRRAHISRHRAPNAGYSFVELMMALAIFGVLGTLATSGYNRVIASTRIAAAKNDIMKIRMAIEGYRSKYFRVPDSLADINMDSLRDPWGRAYSYLSFATVKGNSQKRKDRNLVPINSEYDLYSMGADGKSLSPLTAKASHDDIIMANNGGYIGLAKDY
jgi:general secretion pathway protein G